VPSCASKASKNWHTSICTRPSTTRKSRILSAEIIVITLGTVAGQPFSTQLTVLIGIALLNPGAWRAGARPRGRCVATSVGGIAATLASMAIDAVVGVVAGAIVLAAVELFRKARGGTEQASA